MTTTKAPSTEANEPLDVVNSLKSSGKEHKRTLEGTRSVNSITKRPKMSKRNTFIEGTVNNASKATSDSSRGFVRDAGARVNTTPKQLNKQQQATQRPSALEGLSVSTTKSHSSDLSGLCNKNSFALPSPSSSPPPLPKVSSDISNNKASREPSLSPNSSYVPWSWHYQLIRNGWVDKSGNGSLPRSRARSYRPARRSRAGPEDSNPFSYSSTSLGKSATTEPTPEPEPLPSPLPSTKTSERLLVQVKAVPGTKAERLAQYMKYCKRPKTHEEEEEEKSDKNKETSQPQTRYNLRSTSSEN